MVILGGGNYLKTADVKNGDAIIFKDEGEFVESTRWTYEDGTPRRDFVIGVEWNGVAKKMRLNKTNRDILVDAYDEDTAGWVGMGAVITVEKIMVAGKKLDTIVLTPTSTGTVEKDPSPEPQDEIPF